MSHEDGERPLIVCVALRGYGRFFRRCIATQREYCRRWEYDYLLIDRLPYRLSPSDASWLKIPLIIRALDRGRSWVVTLDADCEVRTATPPIESLAVPGKSVYLAPGFSGRFNAGVMIVANAPSARALYATILGSGDQPVPREHWAPYENGQVIHCATNHSAVQTLEHHRWNNNSTLDEESFIQHYTGTLRKHYVSAYTSAPDQWLLRFATWRHWIGHRLRERDLSTRLFLYLDVLDGAV